MADDRVAELETICAELHVIIGALAAEAGVYDHPEVSKALDNASECRLVHKDLLPWPKNSSVTRQGGTPLRARPIRSPLILPPPRLPARLQVQPSTRTAGGTE